MTETIETTDITPTFTAMLPVMLDARENMRRKLFATGCDGQADGWCSIHEHEFERSTDTVCVFVRNANGIELRKFRADLEADLRTVEAEFTKMAAFADALGKVNAILTKAGR